MLTKSSNKLKTSILNSQKLHNKMMRTFVWNNINLNNNMKFESLK